MNVRVQIPSPWRSRRKGLSGHAGGRGLSARRKKVEPRPGDDDPLYLSHGRFKIGGRFRRNVRRGSATRASLVEGGASRRSGRVLKGPPGPENAVEPEGGSSPSRAASREAPMAPLPATSEPGYYYY